VTHAAHAGARAPEGEGAPRGIARQQRTQALYGYALATPATLLLLSIALAPTIVVVLMSFTDYQLGALDWSWIGLGNYQDMLSDDTFWKTMRNTFLYVLVVVPVSLFGSLFVAILVQSRIRTRRFYEVIIFLPVTTTLVAMAIVWSFILHTRVGPVNALLELVGLGPVGFLSDANVVLLTLAMIGIWQLVGFNMILFIAGLSGIPQDLYDAARIDGADGWADRFLRVTWPMLGPTTMFVAVTTAITAFKVFDTVVVLTDGGPLGASDVLLYSIYRESFQYFQIGYGAALTTIFLVFILLFTLVQAFLIDRNVHYR
jgi:multiple sugar transport system permease protein